MQLLILFGLAAGLVTIAQSIITTGVVYLMSDFSVSSTQAQWSYSVFLLVVGVMIPLSAYISRRFRARSIFFFSLIIFLIGSVICYFSTSLIILIIGRILQGIENTTRREMADLYGIIWFGYCNSSRFRFFHRRICNNLLRLESTFLIFHSCHNNPFAFRNNICKGQYSY